MESPPLGHGSPGRALRAILFVTLMYLLLAILGILCLLPAWSSRRVALFCIKTYARLIIWLLQAIVGTRVEIRGELPRGPCIVACKHQAFLDILMLLTVLPEPSFVMKKSLRWAPIIGIYAERLGSIPIDRSAGSEAVRAMLAGAARQAAGRQIVVFPQGTRVAPLAKIPYRAGVLRLYAALNQPIVLAALNSGWFWPRVGLRRTPGTAVLEFIGVIPPGRATDGLLDEITARIESASLRLAREAADSIAAADAKARR